MKRIIIAMIALISSSQQILAGNTRTVTVKNNSSYTITIPALNGAVSIQAGRSATAEVNPRESYPITATMGAKKGPISSKTVNHHLTGGTYEIKNLEQGKSDDPTSSIAFAITKQGTSTKKPQTTYRSNYSSGYSPYSYGYDDYY